MSGGKSAWIELSKPCEKAVCAEIRRELVELHGQVRIALIDTMSGRPQCRGCYAYLDKPDAHTDTCWAADTLRKVMP